MNSPQPTAAVLLIVIAAAVLSPDGGGVGMAEDAEHAAIFPQPVAIEIVGHRLREAAVLLHRGLRCSVVMAAVAVVIRLCVDWRGTSPRRRANRSGDLVGAGWRRWRHAKAPIARSGRGAP